MSKVILKGYIKVPESELFLVISALETHKILTLQEPGCLVFEVTQRKDSPHIFDVYEEFIDKPSFELHQQRVKSSSWGEVTVNVERHYQLIE